MSSIQLKIAVFAWLAFMGLECRGQQPGQYFGITLAERQAIRSAYNIKHSWFPQLSPNIKSLLLDRTDQEVVQINVVNSTQWYCRSETRRQLQLEETGKPQDLVLLIQAMDDEFYKRVASESVANLAAVADLPIKLNAWMADLDQSNLSNAEKDDLKLALGQNLAKLPEAQLTALQKDPKIGSTIADLTKAAASTEKSRIDKIIHGDVSPADPTAVKVLAHELANPDGSPRKQRPLKVSPSKDDAKVLLFSTGPANHFLIKADDEQTAAEAAKLQSPQEMRQFFQEKNVAIFSDPASKNRKPERIDFNDVEDAIKAIPKR